MKRALFIVLMVFASIVEAQPQQRKLAVGDTAFCGIVFYVKDSIGKQWVLVCAMQDEGSRVKWNNGNYRRTRAIHDSIFGKANADQVIVKQGPVGRYAANICRFAPAADRMCNDSTRWYLPSRAELKIMFDSLAKTNKVKFAKEGYWSSVERAPLDTMALRRSTERKAWIVDFLNGRAILNDKANKYNVRAIKEEINFF